jgi:hypothetical protein
MFNFGPNFYKLAVIIQVLYICHFGQTAQITKLVIYNTLTNFVKTKSNLLKCVFRDFETTQLQHQHNSNDIPAYYTHRYNSKTNLDNG